MAQSRDLEALLRRCTVRVEQGQGHGTGFFVAPGLVVTCAHVVETTDAQTASVTIYWQGQTYRARIEKIFASPYPDLALLRTELQEHPCVYLHTAITLDDPLYSFTYPDNYPEGDSVTCWYEGPTGTAAPLLKLKNGQIRPGMSGAPLLNRRTGGVCGIIKRTRDRDSDLGGRAVPISVLIDANPFLREEQAAFHQRHDLWLGCLTPQQQGEIPWRVSGRMSNPFLGESPRMLGRDHEVRRIEEKLRTGNHCSIVGPPGSGKSLLLETITQQLPSWLGCQSHQVLSIHCRSVTSLHDIQSVIVEHLGGHDASELRRLFQLKPLCLLILDDLGGMDVGEQGWSIRRWLRSLDDQYRTKLLMVSNERLEILFRKDDPTRDSPLDGLDPIPVELTPLSLDICRQIVQERLAGTTLHLVQFEQLFTEPRQPKELLRLCAVRYEQLR